MGEVDATLADLQAQAERATLRAEDPLRWLTEEVQGAMGTRCAARDRAGRCGTTEGLVLARRGDWKRPEKIEASADPAQFILICKAHQERGLRARGREQQGAAA